MKIALLTDGIFPYVIGGMQRHSFYLAKFLAASGHQVDLYHTNQSEKDIQALDVFTEAEKKNIRSFVVEFPKMGEFPGHYIRESYEYSRRIWAIFKKQSRVDFIYVKGFAGWELINQKTKGADLPPVGVNFHGYEMFQPAASLKEKFKYWLLFKSPVKFSALNADYLFSYGGKITGIIRELGVQKNRIIEIPTGIEPSWLIEKVTANPNRKRKRFVFVGRFERRKGLPELNEQLRSISAAADFDFAFVGDIPKKHQLTGDKYEYFGKVTDTKQLQTILSDADILVCPSFSEGMPNVIIEGMARGLAIIATDVGAVSVAVNEENGWLIPPANGNALKKVILDACKTDDAVLLKKRQNALRDVREKFLWTRIIEQTVSAIDEIVQMKD